MLTVNAARLDASDPCKTSQVSLLNIWAVMRVFRPSNQRASRSSGMLKTSEKYFCIKLRGTQWTWFDGSDVYASSQSSHVMLHPEGTSHEHFDSVQKCNYTTNWYGRVHVEEKPPQKNDLLSAGHVRTVIYKMSVCGNVTTWVTTYHIT